MSFEKGFMKCRIGFLNLLILLLKLIQTNANHSVNSTETLSLLFMITRHGARTPLFYPPGDPNNEYWKETEGQLTNVGKMQLYEFGKSIRSRYNGYLDELYKPEEITIQSTKNDITIMSAQTFLAGFYPPKDAQVWHPTLAWQPIPFQEMQYKTDALYGNEAAAIFSKCANDTEDDTFFKQHQVIIEIIQTATGIRYTKCLDFKFFAILDTFLVEDYDRHFQKFYNLSLAFGLDDKYEDIKKLKDDFMIRFITLPELIRGYNAELFKNIADVLKTKTKSAFKTRAFFYFMNDANVSAFLAAITNYPLKGTSFAASIAIEMHKMTAKGKDTFNIKVFYAETPESNPNLLEIKGCGYNCPIDDFIEVFHTANAQTTSSGCPCQLSE